MGQYFEWKNEYNIGVDSIDKDHQQLFRSINKLFTFREEEKDNQWLCEEGIKFFKVHAVKHFRDEEEYMSSIHYEGIKKHIQIHNGFKNNTLPALERELKEANYSQDAMDHFLGVCAGWLIGHTMTEDLALTGKNRRKWENLLPEEELSAMKNVVAQLVFDMFHLEAQLVSDIYGGEQFGNGVYYRLIYGTKDKKLKQQIFLVFEENLLINTVGKTLGIQTNKLDMLLIHAARYTTRQFVGRVLEQFPSMEEYELQEENLLSYEQFEKIMKQETMQVSLLYNAGGAGYFAYCVIAPHLLESGVGVPIGADNAMTEVEEYLKKRNKEGEEHKPKVLIVDDSKTIRYFMRDLLLENYEVTLAESGVAAIRAITLNRPDLVLLDYEMPVCDGAQTLEMLRSEEAFRDLPVIFLTGKADPTSVKKVMSLKPAGYLLKNLKPDEIKKEIKGFFEKKKA